jgi:hypothetical protein
MASSDSAALFQQFKVALGINQQNTYSYGMLLGHFYTTRCLSAYSLPVAAMAFCIYDVILSFGQEVKILLAQTPQQFDVVFRLKVKYIWKSKLSPVTVLYVVVRYFTVATLMCVFPCHTQVTRRLYFATRFVTASMSVFPSNLLSTYSIGSKYADFFRSRY